MLKDINLQLFAEGDTTSQGDTTVAQQNDNTNQSTEVQTQQQEQTQTVDYTPFLNAIGEKAKFNHEPAKPNSIDDVITNYQKGLNYDNVYQRYAQLQNDPSLSFVASQAQKYGMTPQQYIEAVRQQEQQEQINQLIQRNIPPEYAKEMLENRQFRQQYQTQQEEQQRKAAEQKQYDDFLKTYPDVKPEDIPVEVWQEVENGRSLVDAYRAQEVNQLKGKLAQYEQQSQAQQANAQNAAASTGSLTGKGDVPNGFISKEIFEQNKNNQSWLSKNYDSLKKSMNKW